jgi:hypothetical protein
MTAEWLHAKVDFYSDVARADQDEALAWLRGLGVEPTRCAPQFVITKTGDGGEDLRFQLHLTQHALNEQGDKFIDFAADRVHSEPITIDLGTEAPMFPWLLAALATQDRRKRASVTLRRTEAQVVVLEAPKYTTASLEFIQHSDPGLLGIRGAELHLGKDEQGREVVYRVIGWQKDPPALELRRIEPPADVE